MNHDYSTDALKFGLVQYDSFYNGHIQQDSSECLMMLTEAINKGSVPYCGSNHNFTGVSLISYFHLYMSENYTVCDVCGLRSPPFEAIAVCYILCLHSIRNRSRNKH